LAQVHLTERPQLRQWLELHHGDSRGVWLVSWRRPELGPRIPYDDIVNECICFGWIDSTLRTLDEDRNALRLTPRKPGSAWARTNKLRLARLESTGLMHPAGLAAVKRAKADGSWELLADVEALVVPDDLAAALAAAKAAQAFANLTPSRRKQLLWWIKTAKRDDTRSTRIAKTVAAADEGRSALE
jgi:uncharacterized protein YdeI (YjbR/CyaY-like superfamily)